LLKHEKKAFLKFFFTYFGSIALLILASGFFYFQEKEKEMLQIEHFSMIEFIRQVKMGDTPTTNNISYTILDIELPNFTMSNFSANNEYFEKYMPYSWKGGYMFVKKNKKEFYKNLLNLKLKVISIQLTLIILFAILSYFLSLRALRPMQEAITKLDNFSKDLIHDLNTPITSILLNMKILEKNQNIDENKPLARIKKNVENISELHNNLTTLLQEDTMQIQKENIISIVKDVVITHQKIYTNLEYTVDTKDFFANINKNAFTQILTNLISNASKYNKEDGYIKIYIEDKTLHVEDNGIGIKNPDEIFNRSYTEQKNTTGLGLDITKRLCEAMDINISATSHVGNGTTVSLEFKDL